MKKKITHPQPQAIKDVDEFFVLHKKIEEI